jgi:hypothetical protein
LSFYAFWRQASNRMIAIRKLTELLEKDNRGLRPRPGSPQPQLAGGPPPGASAAAVAGDVIPIELPHFFGSEISDNDFSPDTLK